MSLPGLHWKELRHRYPNCEVELHGKVGTRYYVAKTPRGEAMVDWSSFDARDAQTYLDQRVAKTAKLRKERLTCQEPPVQNLINEVAEGMERLGITPEDVNEWEREIERERRSDS